MDFADTLFDDVWYWLAWFAWLAGMILAARRADWRVLRDPERLNVWLGMVVLLTLVWSMKAGVQPGLKMHLVGANLFALCVGPGLAFIGLNFVLLGVTLNAGNAIFPFAFEALLVGGGGVLFGHLFARLVARFCPAHFFVYIFLNGFFGSAFSILALGALSTAVLGIGGVYGVDFLFSDFYPYFILLAFSEAWLSGMLLTLFVVYRPAWVTSFDDQQYLRGK